MVQFLHCIASSVKKMLVREESRFGSPSLDLCVDPTVAAILGDQPTLSRFELPAKCDTYVGWGRKSGALAARLARKRGKSLLLMEDGFLRSFTRDEPSMSVNLDDIGIYYDASGPSRLEELIKQPLTEEQILRIQAVLASWREHELSKYNAGCEYAGNLPDKYVLVVDQVKNDASVRFGMADEGSFHAMLELAIKENPESDIIVKIHPDIYTKSKYGHFDVSLLKKMPKVIVIAETCLPTKLIKRAEKVYTVTSQVGFEALIWGKPVCCMGMPFYAGWGLTDDKAPAPKRRRKVTLEQLAFAALLSYPRYVHPLRNEICDIEMIIEILASRKNFHSSVV